MLSKRVGKRQEFTLADLGVVEFTGQHILVNVFDRGSTSRQMQGVRKRKASITKRIKALGTKINKRFGLTHHVSGKLSYSRPIWEAAKRETIRTRIPLVIVTPSRLARHEDFIAKTQDNELPEESYLRALIKGIPRNLIFTLANPACTLNQDREFLKQLERESPKPQKRGRKRSTKAKIVKQMRIEGNSVTEIARVLSISRARVYKLLQMSTK